MPRDSSVRQGGKLAFISRTIQDSPIVMYSFNWGTRFSIHICSSISYYGDPICRCTISLLIWTKQIEIVGCISAFKSKLNWRADFLSVMSHRRRRRWTAAACDLARLLDLPVLTACFCHTAAIPTVTADWLIPLLIRATCGSEVHARASSAKKRPRRDDSADGARSEKKHGAAFIYAVTTIEVLDHIVLFE